MEAVFAAPARYPETMTLLIPNDVIEWVRILSSHLLHQLSGHGTSAT